MVRSKRIGFTLIELLVALGIILLLMAIGVLAFSKLDKIASEKSTRTRLEMCASIQAEYETTQSLANSIEGNPGPTNAIAGTPQIYTLGTVLGNPGDVTVGSGQRYTGMPQPAPATPGGIGAVYRTGEVFQRFSLVANCRNMISQLPASDMLDRGTGLGGYQTPCQDQSLNSLPIIVDAWKNPIIFVPSGGLSGVTIGATSVTTGITGVTKTVKSIDGRPFWASAGADGDFSQGDDNLYSCTVVYH